MSDGWIKIHRKLLQWEWWHYDHMVKLFIYLILKANHADNQFEGVTIKRGQLVTGFNSLCKETNMTVQELRTGFKRLEKTGEIILKSNTRFTLVTVCNYEEYQIINKTANKRTTNEQQTNNNKQERKELKKGLIKLTKPDFLDVVIEAFAQRYEFYRSETYYVTNKGKERAAVGKLLAFFKAKNPDAKSDETLTELIGFFDLCINVNDQWLHDNVSLNMIFSKLNSYITIIKNGKVNKGAVRKGNESSDAELQTMLEHYTSSLS